MNKKNSMASVRTPQSAAGRFLVAFLFILAIGSSLCLGQVQGPPSPALSSEYSIAQSGPHSELASLLGTVGRVKDLEALQQQLKGRDLHGAAAAKLSFTLNALRQMENSPTRTFKCGPYAVARMRAALNLPTPFHPEIDRISASSNGTSLVDNFHLAHRTGMETQMARRKAGASVPMPALVHWKLGHFSALTKFENGFYKIEDSATSNGWISAKALDDEASGYFLLAAGPLPSGWTAVSAAQGQTVWGTGWPNQTNPDAPGDCSPSDGGCGGGGPNTEACDHKGMAQYTVNLLGVSLTVADLPVGYSPPRGPAVEFRVTYNEQEANQPSVFSFSNLGSQWSFNWLSYILGPTPQGTITENVKMIRGSGGAWTFNYLAASNSQTYYVVQPTCMAQLSSTNISTNSYTYNCVYADGTTDLYTLPQSIGGGQERVFLSQRIDPAGNTITYNYDANYRLISVQDAIGQVTTLSYGSTNIALPQFYQITNVTDPFGRFATVQYNSSSQLTNITDEIGISSSFTYGRPGESDFINSLTTPYGTTTFTNNNLAFYGRWIQITDPLGAQERVEFANTNSPLPSYAIPEGWNVSAPTWYPNSRTTFYWDKMAMQYYPGDCSKATRYVWLTEEDNDDIADDTLQYIIRPLENPVYYAYPSQTQGQTEGSIECTVPNCPCAR